jgi:RNA 3'-terminal phosphate cyclase (ATP)
VVQVSDDLLAEMEHGGCVDEYLRDQLVVFQALADGRSTVYGGMMKDTPLKPSLHARTAQWVAKEILGVEFDDKGGCEGIGFEVKANAGETEDLARALGKLNVDDT